MDTTTPTSSTDTPSPQGLPLAGQPGNLALAAAAVGGLAWLLGQGPVRTVLKLGAVAALGWVAYRKAEDAGWLTTSGLDTTAANDEATGEMSADTTGTPAGDATPLAPDETAEATQRLASAWGAHYTGPEGDAAQADDASATPAPEGSDLARH